MRRHTVRVSAISRPPCDRSCDPAHATSYLDAWRAHGGSPRWRCSAALVDADLLPVNDDLDRILPTFTNLGRPGLDLGVKVAQFIDASATAENQTLAIPQSVHKIPCNKNNQDVVSMGAYAVLLPARGIKDAFDGLAITSAAALSLDEERALSTAVSNMALPPKSAGESLGASRVRDVHRWLLPTDAPVAGSN